MDEAARQRSERAFRPGTVANHESHVLLFIAFAMHFKFLDFPASPRVLICFGELLLRTFTAPKSALNALSSIRRFHLDWRFDDAAFADVVVARWRRALPLTMRAVPRKAQALPFPVLERLCQANAGLGPEADNFAPFLTICFHVFARASSLLPGGTGEFDASRLPTLGDVRRAGQGFSLKLKWDKTHQATWEAFEVPLLPRPLSPACPVQALNSLLERGAGRPGGTPLFDSLDLAGARSWLRFSLRKLGCDPSEFSLHSLRRGGCTLAYAGGAAVSDLQSLGGWRSSAVHLYHDSGDARRRAARAMLASTSNPHPTAAN